MDAIYVSDLDGTLLRNDATLSPFSRGHLARLLDDGLAFTVASARSVVSMQTILAGLPLRLPVVEMNGAFLSDLATGRHLVTHAVEPVLLDALHAFLLAQGCVPFVSTFNGREDCLYYAALANDGMQWYERDRLAARDRRLRRVGDLRESFGDQVVCLTLVDRREALADLAAALAEHFPGQLATNFFENRYSPGWFWLTVHDRRCTKDQAVRALLEEAGFEPGALVAFGDHWNDIELLRMAGTAVAVANAADELKEHATEVIGPNEDDSVVRYLLWERGLAASSISP
jgi:Cof subfamily protein (haloacid dehalogenase superfamily)